MEDELRRIAERVRTWRIEADLTLQDVSERSGVSASTVHKIENQQMVPTIAVLLKVAHGLGRRPHELFDGVGATKDRGAVLRSTERRSLQTREGSALERVVGAIDDAEMDVWRVTHEPGFGSQPSRDTPPHRYRGELVILVETGRLRVVLGGSDDPEIHELAAGDTIHFKTSVPHTWQNAGEESVTALFFGLLTRSDRRRA